VTALVHVRGQDGDDGVIIHHPFGAGNETHLGTPRIRSSVFGVSRIRIEQLGNIEIARYTHSVVGKERQVLVGSEAPRVTNIGTPRLVIAYPGRRLGKRSRRARRKPTTNVRTTCALPGHPVPIPSVDVDKDRQLRTRQIRMCFLPPSSYSSFAANRPTNPPTRPFETPLIRGNPK